MTFKEESAALFKSIGEAQKMVLATSADDRTTARMMSCVMIENKIYFQTDKTLLKYAQICKNPHVALCADNIQIEGICRFLGHPTQHQPFLQLFQKHYPSAFKSYSHMQNEVLAEIVPSLITLWCYEGDKPYRKFYDYKKKTFYIQNYNNGSSTEERGK